MDTNTDKSKPTLDSKWVEVFRAGQHTDAFGKVKNWTESDLDQMVHNFAAGSKFPLVIGHPKTDSPAYGWGAALKRHGKSLLAQFSAVPDAVASAIASKAYPHRSAKIAPSNTGWKLLHVGLLGAAAPAIEGLQPIQFAADTAGETYQFDSDDGYQLSLIARMFRGVREFLICRFDQATADSVLPDYNIAALERAAIEESMEPDDDDAQAQPQTQFSQQQQEPTAVSFTQQQVDAAIAAALAKQKADQAAEFAAGERKKKAKEIVDKAVAEGRVLPAQAAGLSEFMSSLSAEAFTFSASDGTQATKDPYEFMCGFVAALPKQVELGREIAGGDAGVVDLSDSESITRAARQFQKQEADKGHVVEWHVAVSHVSQSAGS